MSNLIKDNKQSCEFSSYLSDNIVASLLEPLPCGEEGTLTCMQSENVNKAEFSKFFQNFHGKTVQNNNKTSNWTSQKVNIDKHCKNIDFMHSKNGNNKCNEDPPFDSFKTAREVLQKNSVKKNGNSSIQNQASATSGTKKKLGTRRQVNSKFVSPLLSSYDSMEEAKSDEWSSDTEDQLKHIEPKMIELIKSEIMENSSNTTWDDIVGLEFAKTTIQEAVLWPMLRPDIFTGLRKPPKGILLFGPPGTGKTLIGKCIASQSKSTFFNISASSLTSKWVGDGEKMVRALFSVARVHQPAVIFIDEIDSLLSQRSSSEHESSRRIKTEFLVQLDGATTECNEKLLIIGATNRPQELDEAARRRFVKRLYIPLPSFEARNQLVQKLISKERNCLSINDFESIATLSDGYSGADILNVCSEASLGPIRCIDKTLIEKIQPSEVRPVTMSDFENALVRVKSSVSPNDLEEYLVWDGKFGSGCGF